MIAAAAAALSACSTVAQVEARAEAQAAARAKISGPAGLAVSTQCRRRGAPGAGAAFSGPEGARDGAVGCIRLSHYHQDLCREIGRNADRRGLPRGFFARLIWRESRFDPNAVSPKGAQGVAQFMPGTARLRGLENPFNPVEALAASADLLADLRREFGNLGLAAAAYNAGSGRVRGVLAGRSGAPRETRAYVDAITGRPLSDWTDRKPRTIAYELGAKDFQSDCVRLGESRKIKRFAPASAPWRPWGVQLAQHRSAATARRAFTRAAKRHAKVLGAARPLMTRVSGRAARRGRWIAQIGRDSRRAAETLCGRLRAAGGA
ncbi:MAG: lytic transglycosylase domain-containing protein, partial [Pseudomonadota bacterium]